MSFYDSEKRGGGGKKEITKRNRGGKSKEEGVYYFMLRIPAEEEKTPRENRGWIGLGKVKNLLYGLPGQKQSLVSRFTASARPKFQEGGQRS